MANAFLLKPLAATVTAVSSTPQLGGGSYLLNDYAGVVGQWALDAAGNSCGITIDLGADTAIDTIMAFGTELFPAAGTLLLQYATAAQGNFTGAYNNDASPLALRRVGGLDERQGCRLVARGQPRDRAVSASDVVRHHNRTGGAAVAPRHRQADPVGPELQLRRGARGQGAGQPRLLATWRSAPDGAASGSARSA